MPMKSCVESLGIFNPPNQFENSIPMPTSLPNVPTYTSSIMVTYTQKFNPTHVSNGWDSINQYSYIPPSTSLPFVSQQSPIPTYHNVPPCYSQAPLIYPNITPSQSNMSNSNSSTEAAIKSSSKCLILTITIVFSNPIQIQCPYNRYGKPTC